MYFTEEILDFSLYHSIFLGIKWRINQVNDIRARVQNIDRNKTVKFGVCLAAELEIFLLKLSAFKCMN